MELLQKLLGLVSSNPRDMERASELFRQAYEAQPSAFPRNWLPSLFKRYAGFPNENLPALTELIRKEICFLINVLSDGPEAIKDRTRLQYPARAYQTKRISVILVVGGESDINAIQTKVAGKLKNVQFDVQYDIHIWEQADSPLGLAHILYMLEKECTGEYILVSDDGNICDVGDFEPALKNRRPVCLPAYNDTSVITDSNAPWIMFHRDILTDIGGADPLFQSVRMQLTDWITRINQVQPPVYIMQDGSADSRSAWAAVSGKDMAMDDALFSLIHACPPPGTVLACSKNGRQTPGRRAPFNAGRMRFLRGSAD